MLLNLLMRPPGQTARESCGDLTRPPAFATAPVKQNLLAQSGYHSPNHDGMYEVSLRGDATRWPAGGTATQDHSEVGATERGRPQQLHNGVCPLDSPAGDDRASSGELSALERKVCPCLCLQQLQGMGVCACVRTTERQAALGLRLRWKVAS